MVYFGSRSPRYLSERTRMYVQAGAILRPAPAPLAPIRAGHVTAPRCCERAVDLTVPSPGSIVRRKGPLADPPVFRPKVRRTLLGPG